MRPLAFAAVALIALPALTACQAAREAVVGPKLGPMAYPTPLVAQNQPVLESSREPLPQAPTANSLWRTGARDFFVDQRAARVGDILTVLISMNDSAKTQNNTTTDKTSANKIGIPHFFGLESTLGKILPKAYDPTDMIETSLSSSTNGTGGVNRSEEINLTIAAVVTQVLPNGNMVIQGTQEVQTNGELRQLTVSGIVRPEDITSRNTINHTQIAEARISYGGRGDVSAVQRTPAGTGMVQRFWPF
jgi:flagellar L-ring protein precursor FlgH